jgi:hypothetical protein
VIFSASCRVRCHLSASTVRIRAGTALLPSWASPRASRVHVLAAGGRSAVVAFRPATTGSRSGIRCRFILFSCYLGLRRATLFRRQTGLRTLPKSAVLPSGERPIASAGRSCPEKRPRGGRAPLFSARGGRPALMQPSLARAPRWGYRFVGPAQLRRRLAAPKSLSGNALSDAWRARARPGICSRRSRNVAS